jgi:hypothetical protein
VADLCPLSHPFAFNEGKNCCKFYRENDGTPVERSNNCPIGESIAANALQDQRFKNSDEATEEKGEFVDRAHINQIQHYTIL